ncbi:MAG: hypothetical protein ACLGID_03030 [Gammaproteobacteria bacterium]
MQSTPYQTPSSELSAGKHRIGYLGGEKPLWKAFWLVYVLGFALVYVSVRFVVLDAFGNAIIELVRSWNELVILTSLQEVYGLIGFTPLLMYTCFSLLVVWRCGRNTSWVGWTILARSMVALTALFTGATVIFCVWKVF